MRFYLGGPMKILVFTLLAALFMACSDGGRDTVELEVSYSLEQGTTCETYLADHFLVTVYDSEQRKVTEKKNKCGSDNSDRLTLVVEKGLYYISVVLRSSDNLWQSYGATKAEVVDDSNVKVEMKNYIGGMIFLWNPSDCGKYTLSQMTLTMESDGSPVEAVVWGEDVAMKDYPFPCAAGRIEALNIPPEQKYTAEINGFRLSGDKESRIKYMIPEFVSGHGQNKSVNIDKYKEVLVSDMKVSWEFDSKSIDSCGTAGISKVKASLVSDSATVSEEQNCDNKFSDFYLYNILDGTYTLYLEGISPDGETLFESSLDAGKIEPGHVGDDILKNKILLKEK